MSLAQTVSAVVMTHPYMHTYTYSHSPNTEEVYFTSDFLYQCFVLIGLIWK